MNDVKPLLLPGARKQPNGVPQTLVVQKLTEAAPAKVGRKRKLKMPPLPQAILDGMTPLEREHFEFLIAAYNDEYGDSLTPADQISLQQAAIEYINLLRVQADQLSTGKIISMARQHPGVQLRQWLDSLSVTRKQRAASRPEDKQTAALTEELLKLSA